MRESPWSCLRWGRFLPPPPREPGCVLDTISNVALTQLTSKSASVACTVVACEDASNSTPPLTTTRSDYYLKVLERPTAHPVGVLTCNLKITVLTSQILLRRIIRILQLVLMLNSPNHLGTADLAFFLSCAPGAPNCQLRYVVQAFLLCPLTTSTIDMQRVAKLWSLIFHFHTLGINFYFCWTITLFWLATLLRLAGLAAGHEESQWQTALQGRSHCVRKKSHWA